jgi:hypothetical protein
MIHDDFGVADAILRVEWVNDMTGKSHLDSNRLSHPPFCWIHSIWLIKQRHIEQRLTVLQKFSTVSYRALLYFESYSTAPYRFLTFLYRTVPSPPQARGIPYRKIPYRQKKFFFSPKFTIMGYVSYTDYFFWRIRRKKMSIIQLEKEFLFEILE